MDAQSLLPNQPPPRSEAAITRVCVCRCVVSCTNTASHLGQPRHLSLLQPGFATGRSNDTRVVWILNNRNRILLSACSGEGVYLPINSGATCARWASSGAPQHAEKLLFNFFSIRNVVRSAKECSKKKKTPPTFLALWCGRPSRNGKRCCVSPLCTRRAAGRSACAGSSSNTQWHPSHLNARVCGMLCSCCLNLKLGNFVF